ncbi:MAG TPA: hypothetical protein VL051_11825 [Burkholderiaceae bacterium]|nr:hypothetical protein [Burkholderiaceae bacterium]
MEKANGWQRQGIFTARLTVHGIALFGCGNGMPALSPFLSPGGNSSCHCLGDASENPSRSLPSVHMVRTALGCDLRTVNSRTMSMPAVARLSMLAVVQRRCL